MSAFSLPSVNPSRADSEVILHAKVEAFYYDRFLALRNVYLPIYKNLITTLIGPSGCGKSTLLRCFNRLNDLIPQTRLQGQIIFKGRNIYHPLEDAVVLRRNIGMVFQKPNPFPKSIYNNVAFGLRIQGYRGDIDEIVEHSLRQAILWDEVKNKLKENALSLSGGQQQRLCIARMLAVQPEIILMDEPCSALDPTSTKQIEALIKEIKQQHTIVIVTHNMQQASRISDMTAFFNTEMIEGSRTGELVEYDHTPVIFQNPTREITRQYVNGYFG
ncbi:phosphate ABC transporter ATP-binding protein [Trichormus variabilis ARAD]|nr:phosphate ABC transporter ATP-binding protein PstB [Trichormus variabilis]MBC1213883.1 phosphate ABC transporter ATP-binding protein [Trichormus variabilis ARAD]MBC1255494.1 phosphate ABC transporter ATP-binding protein [Trichormus variabilis V5]MBC1266017.1 phosphate ABC transporter ATP-binding protein [Trichormus variabilis FSR]MBC1302033.1 phosphate ABC transporter ATP-binding protein [Trichormus variabilis N2B]MBC1310875.1 phosphate ABC transporter ATP-binding protein [Trichormus variab